METNCGRINELKKNKKNNKKKKKKENKKKEKKTYNVHSSVRVVFLKNTVHCVYYQCTPELMQSYATDAHGERGIDFL